MSVDFKDNVPIYLQIMQDIKKQIAAGKLHEKDKVSSVRELALYYGVNPNISPFLNDDVKALTFLCNFFDNTEIELDEMALLVEYGADVKSMHPTCIKILTRYMED